MIKRSDKVTDCYGAIPESARIIIRSYQVFPVYEKDLNVK